jgi:hypothetical protein
LEKAAADTARKLTTTLQEATNTLPEQPEPDPYPVLKLYWQARWLELAARHEGWHVPGLQASLAAAQQSALLLRDRAASVLTDVTRPADLARAQTCLDALQALNHGLTHRAQDADDPAYVALPDLPPGAQYEEQPAPLDAAALQAWAKEVTYWNEQSRQAAAREDKKNTAPAEGDTAPATAVVPASQDDPSTGPFDLERVTAVEALALKAWPPASSLGRLEQEAGLHADIAGIMVQAFRAHQRNEALDGIKLLYQDLEQPKKVEKLEPFSLWLLAPQRAALDVAYDALRGELIEGLGAQVAGILREQATAARRLRDEIIKEVPGEAGWIADVVVEAVRVGVNRRDQEAQADGRTDEARALWKIVLDATEPWADPSASHWWSRARRRRDTAPDIGTMAGRAVSVPEPDAKPVKPSPRD